MIQVQAAADGGAAGGLLGAAVDAAAAAGARTGVPACMPAACNARLQQRTGAARFAAAEQLHLAITTHGQMHSTGPPKHISNSSNKHQTTKRPQADILCAVDETRGDLIATCRHCASFVASCQVRTPRPLPAQAAPAAACASCASCCLRQLCQLLPAPAVQPPHLQCSAHR